MRRFDLAGKLDGGLMISLVASTSRFGFVLLPGKRTSRQAKMLTQKLHIAKKTNRSEDMMCSEVESLQRPCCLIFHRASSQPGDNHSTCAVAWAAGPHEQRVMPIRRTRWSRRSRISDRSGPAGRVALPKHPRRVWVWRNERATRASCASAVAWSRGSRLYIAFRQIGGSRLF